jgi:hypothetical protein
MGPTIAYYRNVNDFLKTQSGLQVSPYSCVHANLSVLSQFSDYDSLKMPFVISGRLISVGTYRDASYGKVSFAVESLKESTEDWVSISIFTSHAVYEKVIKGEDVSVNEVVGKIIKTSWNEKDQGIDFVAEIYDKQIAFKMANGLIRFISVGFARDIVMKDGQYYFMNIDPKEASLVFDPKDKKAEFKPV